MSIENEIAGLTQSTTDLLEAVNTKKATLDTAVSNAQTAVTDATSQVSLAAAEKVGAQTARDTAESFKDQAYTYSQSAASAVAYQDLTAIAQTKAETAVDVFVYDTSKDSDGGAWRQRTQHTSWYNETLNTATRGSRKEFPAVAVIVRTATSFTIYDGDDPSMPMWMVFNGTTSSDLPRYTTAGNAAIHAVNGIVSTGSNSTVGDITVINFISEYSTRGNSSGQYVYNGSIADRNSSKGWALLVSTAYIPNRTINDIAMTVLPDAPIDPATGLPIPTIAVATDGGVSVIKDDGTVVDSTTNYATPTAKVAFTEDYGIWYSRNVSIYRLAYASREDYLAGDGFGISVAVANGGGYFTMPTRGREGLVDGGGNLFLGGSNASQLSKRGVGVIHPDYNDFAKSMIALYDNRYNTGWMNGDIKLATLSDTDDTDLVGSELVTNGTFDTDISGWSSQLGGILTHTGSAIQVQSVGNNSLAYQTITADLSKEYIITADLVSGSGAVSAGGNFYTFTNGKLYAILPAGRLNNKVDLSPSANTTAVFDNISVRPVELDRSVNNNGLQVFGTVTREPVATGADLVGYSGDSTDKLVLPNSEGLDFGLGDFCITVWAKQINGDLCIIYNGDGSSYSPTSGIHFWLNGGYVKYSMNTGLRQAATPAGNTNWALYNFVRKDGIVHLYQNGVLFDSSDQSTKQVTATEDASVLSGFYGNHPHNRMALLRISATAPTAEQIEKIYNDEKVLFQEGAQATLYGTSDAVKALAYDDTTELLHVGTSSGRSVFQGLKRVDNTTDAVGTAISASNNLVVEE